MCIIIIIIIIIKGIYIAQVRKGHKCAIRPPCLLVLSREPWHWYSVCLFFSINAVINNNNNHYHTRLTASSRTTWVSRYQKCITSQDLNEARDDGVWGWQWRQVDHMQTICTSLQTDNHTNTSSLNFYRPDALPDAQPTVSKHWRHAHASQFLQ